VPANLLSPGLRLALGLAVCATISACASQPVEFHYNLSGVDRVWPGAPETPRYKFVGQLLGEQNFETKSGGLASLGTKVVKWIVGLGSASPSGPVELQRPQGVTVDDQGRVYVTDISRQAVMVFDQKKGRLDVWQMAAKNTRFKSPVGIAIDAGGDILVADADLHEVVRLNPAGKPVGTLGDGYLERPTGLARDAATGRVYVSDTWAHHIQVFDADGKLVQTIGGPGVEPGQFNRPTYLYIAHDRLYVSDTLNARIQVLTLDGKPLQTFGRRGIFMGDTPRPKGVAVDKDGNIYVVESYYDYLLVFNAQGKLLLPIGGTGNTVGRFYLPAGIWVDKEQRVYIADMFNGRVVIFQYLGGA
jgi:DNA-binding beta-propeller fold protein YncE